MKFRYLLLIALFSIAYKASSKLIYSDPVPNAKYVNTNNTIILGFDCRIRIPHESSKKLIYVEGNKSGVHSGKLIVLNDGAKLIFRPDTPFSVGEVVLVKTITDMETEEGNFHPGINFRFFTETGKIIPDDESGSEDDISSSTKQQEPLFEGGLVVAPQLTVTISDNPAPGKLFLSNIPVIVYTTPYLLIAENSGSYFTAIQMEASCQDFKKQPNGNLTYFNKSKGKYYEMNNNYQVIDSFYCGNGFSTDQHELRVLSDRHALLMSYDYQQVDMSTIVAGGNPNCTVIGLIIQEIDENKNVVFQWRSWDHFMITDAVHQNMLAGQIDYVHGNALELDNDSNILLSSRHLDEITKISRTTGVMLWRLGGIKNQFTFINDPDKFSYQHAVRRIANGNITLFDNGNFHAIANSRAVEYSLDETNKTATLVWEYRHTPDIFGSTMGYVQRLPGGNTLISWGSANTTLTEVKPDGSIALEMHLPFNVYSYRVTKDEWNGSPLVSAQPVSSDLPNTFSLEQNFPNPFNPETRIEFRLKSSEFVNLSVYDITGQEVRRLVNSYLNRGVYQYSFNSEGLSSGIYIYRLNAGEFSTSKKMILLK